MWDIITINKGCHSFDVGQNRVFGYGYLVISCSSIDTFRRTVLSFQDLNIRLRFTCHRVERENARHSHTHRPTRSDRSVFFVNNFYALLNDDHDRREPRQSEFNVHFDEQDLQRLRMVNTNVTDKQSFHFIIRSGLAGGFAGCVVGAFRIILKQSGLTFKCRQRQLSHPSTESRSSSRRRTQISKSMQVRIGNTWISYTFSGSSCSRDLEWGI